MVLPLLLATAFLLMAVNAPAEVRTEDFAMLPFNEGVLFNNVFAKNGIREARQRIFHDEKVAGWSWEWPESAGPSVKTYPEIILGRSPWSAARGGDRLPRRLSEARMVLDFDFSAEGTGSWCTSFDFWVTSKPEPVSKDIVFNFTVWTQTHGLAIAYKGKREQVTIGGRSYLAILETPADAPQKAWSTLCLVEDAPRSQGSLDVGAIVDFILSRGLALPDHFLATAELGSEVAYGKGSLTLRTFALR